MVNKFNEFLGYIIARREFWREEERNDLDGSYFKRCTLTLKIPTHFKMQELFRDQLHAPPSAFVHDNRPSDGLANVPNVAVWQ